MEQRQHDAGKSRQDKSDDAIPSATSLPFHRTTFGAARDNSICVQQTTRPANRILTVAGWGDWTIASPSISLMDRPFRWSHACPQRTALPVP